MSTKKKKKAARKNEDLGFFGLTGSLEQNLRRMQLIREQNREDREERAEAEQLGVTVLQMRRSKHEEDNKPIVVDLASIPVVELKWLWPERIPLGKITVFSGDPGLGKSYVALDIAARVSNGSEWPGEEEGEREEEGSGEEGAEMQNAEAETECFAAALVRQSDPSISHETANETKESESPETESSLAERMHVLQQIRGQILISGQKNVEKQATKEAIEEREARRQELEQARIARSAGVLILSAEDNASDTIHPRLERLGANIDNIKIMTRVKNDGEYDFFSITRDVNHLERAIREMQNCKLVIIDPLASYLSTMGGNSLSAVRKALDPLRSVAEEHDVAILLINHLNKKSGAAIYRSAGSISIAGMARVVWGFTKCKADERRRFMVPLKNNLADDSEGLAYRISDKKVVWEDEPLEISADEAFGNQEKLRGRNPHALEGAVEWLREKLTEQKEVGRTDIELDALNAGISARTLVRAKEKIGVLAKHDGITGRWTWVLPTAQTTVT